ncbi:hypothetical protein COU95_00475 [Candidatus Shapirobacteria bacterium CG10_big_fil_rev_8_21_14_0_10_40_9]|uniref:Cell shape-determining protein MreC n=1 Tax=Candidatus Shapirobacteria bacterium CG10_big_fil_rev_8_21_14_0_10_40_9 TaxID=1974888 RepID=A0A2M8L4D8_9BACT|nr:MAG: hypothetical protein COU95_00475 [Candidatus Shapirobacteria bacterium CG10_big_fil_rev_8_21_14_0_10_40_9]
MRKFLIAKQQALLIFVLASLLLIIFDQLGVIRPIRGRIERILIPIEERLYSLKSKQEPQVLKEERKITDLEAQISALKKENADMRRLLGAPLPSNWQFLPAKVIGEEDGILLLDKGRSDGLTIGQVAVFENIFVGRIVSLGEQICRLETLESKNLKIQATVKNPAFEGATARGILSNSSGKLILDQVLLDESLLEGDLVLTGDLLIGKVKNVSKTSLFQKAEVEPLISYSEQENVFLVIFK